MRVALAGFALESVSFLPWETSLAAFQRSEIRGDEMVQQLRGTNTPVGGFIDVCEAMGWEMVPIVNTELWARGPASDEAFEYYRALIVSELENQRGRPDGVLLHLHGALTTPTRTDPDGEIINAVREAVGPEVPVMLALDYHANLDSFTLRGATAAFGYHYSPHVDMNETGQRAARCLKETLHGRVKPTCAIAKPALMVPSIASATNLAPLQDFVARSISLPRENPRILDVSLFAGFSYADAVNCGFSAVVVTDGDQALAEDTAKALSDEIRSVRKAIYAAAPVRTLDEGLDYACSRAKKADRPVLVLEHADRMNDSTHVLRALVERRADGVAVPYLWDPETAALAVKLGAGQTARLRIGGKSSERAGGPVEATAEILWAGAKSYVSTGAVGGGSRVDLGKAALLRIDGIMVSVTELPNTAIDEDPFVQFGLDARDFSLIVLRSKTHFRAAWEPLAAEIVIVDTPDWGPADLLTLPYRHVPKSQIYPFSD